SVRLKEYIRNIIAKEDPDDPISDGELRDRLAKQGIDIARRTVANYRNEMGIPSTYERRRAR
ncbi:MAG TPA: RNA polymerase factor sigma-54, partial [bacterium]|nr:RNA polymerase factor sigma-54 [bacterium]